MRKTCFLQSRFDGVDIFVITVQRHRSIGFQVMLLDPRVELFVLILSSQLAERFKAAGS